MFSIEMTYEETKIYLDEMEKRHDIDSHRMKEFDKYKSSIGLIPDHVRDLPEWKIAKNACQQNFAELRNFNAWFVKTFKKEMLIDRRNRYNRE